MAASWSTIAWALNARFMARSKRGNGYEASVGAVGASLRSDLILAMPGIAASENGAQERTRTSTLLRAPAPEAGASTNSATWAQVLLFSAGGALTGGRPAL